MNNQGWISVHRKIEETLIYKDSEAVHLWLHLLLHANHKDNKALVGNKPIIVPAGSLLTGRKALSAATGINESKVQRLLKLFEKELQIEQQTFSKYRVISVCNYTAYQEVNNKRTASEQQVNTNNNVNNDNKKEKIKTRRFAPPTIQELQHYIDEKQLGIDGQIFIDYYETNGWIAGKVKMKCWKAAARNWARRNKSNETSKRPISRARQVADKLDEIARRDIEQNGMPESLG